MTYTDLPATPGTDLPATPGTDLPATPDAGAVDTTARTTPLLLIVVLAGLTVALAAAAVALALQLRGYAETDDARADALTAARQSALNLTSIDTESFSADVQAVIDGATGAFLADFEGRSAELEGILADNEVISEGRVIEAGLVRSDARNATALVIVDSTVQNTASPEGRVNTYRMQLELELRDGRWLTSMLEFVG